MKLLPLAVFQSMLLALGQVLLKFALVRMAPVGWNSAFLRSVLLNWQFAACGLCYLSCSMLWMYIVKNFPLSQSYPMVSLSFVFGMIAAIIFFHETVDIAKWVGVALILAGCLLVSSPVSAQNQNAAAFKGLCAEAKNYKSITCDFVQTRTSRMLKSPTVTKGRLTATAHKVSLQYENGKKMDFSMKNMEKRLSRMNCLVSTHTDNKQGVTDRIDITEKNGSKTEIRLYNIQKNK